MVFPRSGFRKVDKWSRQDSLVSGNAYARPPTAGSISESFTNLVPAGAGKTVLTYVQFPL